MTANHQNYTKLTKPTYSYLRGISFHSYELVLQPEEEENKLSNCMISMLFSAFCLEAFFNHLGNEKLTFWSPSRRNVNPRKKLEVFAKVLGFKPNFGNRPYQTFGEIFNFRNLLVHAKTESIILEGDSLLSLGVPTIPPTKWEQQISPENAKKFLDDTKTIIYDLCTRSGLPTDEIFATEISDVKGTTAISFKISGYSSS